MSSSDSANTDLRTSLVSPGYNALKGNILAAGASSNAVTALKAQLQEISPELVLPDNPTVADLQQAIFAASRLSPSGIYQNAVSTQPFVFSFQNLSKQFPGPSKFYSGGATNIPNQRWVLPVPPADFSVSVPNSPSEVTTISGFTYTHAGPIQLDEISFEGFFPDVSDPADLVSAPSKRPQFIPEYINFSSGATEYGYKSPREWVTNLVTAMRANQPLIFSVYVRDGSGSVFITDSGMVVEPVAMSIASFDWNMGVSVGGSRRDVNYSITLKRWRRQSLTLTNYVRQPNQTYGTSQTWPAGSGNSGGNVRIYTVRNRDTLFRIAALPLVLGNGRRWIEIYRNNKKDIDRDYKLYVQAFRARSPNGRPKRRHNYPISPNLVLRIPRK